MRIPFTNIEIGKFLNLDQSKPDANEVFAKITQTQLTRSREDVRKWRNALTSAESITKPSRNDLFRIYREIELDAHLHAVVQTRVNKILSREFQVQNANGELDVDATSMLKKQWFHQFVEYSIGSVFNGFSLIEFGEIINDEFSSVDLIPHVYVVPETQSFKLDLAGKDTVSFVDNGFEDWAMFVGSKTDFGLFNKAVPLLLWKRLILAVWAEYNELFGVPLRIGKTNMRNPEQVDKMETMLKDFGSSAYAMFDETESIEVISGIKVGGQATFRDFIKIVDEQISKLIVGQTMGNDDGSSRSQSEVHERTMDTFVGADLRKIEFVINNQLFPMMARHGLPFEGSTIVWDTEEKLSIQEQFAIDAALLPYYNIPESEILEKYGTTVEQKQTVQTTQNAHFATNSVFDDLGELYNRTGSHKCGD